MLGVACLDRHRRESAGLARSCRELRHWCLNSNRLIDVAQSPPENPTRPTDATTRREQLTLRAKAEANRVVIAREGQHGGAPRCRIRVALAMPGRRC